VTDMAELKVDPRIQIVELCGVRYQMDLFRIMSAGPPGAIFQIVDKGDGTRGLASVIGMAELLDRVKDLEGMVARKSVLIHQLVEVLHERNEAAAKP
jgi:hypothetical protein